MRLLPRLTAISLGAVAAASPLSAQGSPFVGPVRQWTFNQCFEGRIPNADRTALVTGPLGCLDGTMTLGNTGSYTIFTARWEGHYAPGVFVPNYTDVFLYPQPMQALTPAGRAWIVDSYGMAGRPAPSIDGWSPVMFSFSSDYWADVEGYRKTASNFNPVLTANTSPTQFAAVVVTPEPSTYALLGTGLLTLGGIAARERRRAQG
jgi:hypothetical protein